MDTLKEYLNEVDTDFPPFNKDSWEIKKELDNEDNRGENNDHIILSIAISDHLCPIFLTNDRKIITQHEVIRRIARKFRDTNLYVRETLEKSKNQIP